MKRFRPRLTYANVIASWPCSSLWRRRDAAGLPKNSVRTKSDQEGSVTAEGDP